MAKKKNTLNIEDFKRIGRNILIVFSPVLILFLEQIQKGEFDFKVLYALSVSVIIDGIRRYMREVK